MFDFDKLIKTHIPVAARNCTKALDLSTCELVANKHGQIHVAGRYKLVQVWQRRKDA